MRQEHPGDRAKRSTELMQPLHGAAAGVEDKFLGADFDQRARSATVRSRGGAPVPSRVTRKS